MQKKRIVVIGGGTAGWITVNFLKKIFPTEDVTIIYSEKKGIIGVGEATTPQLPEFLSAIGIDLFDFLVETGGSIKHGISFENWNGDGKKFLHPFIENLVDFKIPGVFEHSCWDYYNKLLIKDDLPFSQYLYQNRLANENKVDLQKTKFAVHFDTYEFGKYLKKFSKDKDITVINDELENVSFDENGNINKLHLTNDTLDCDFVFDCTGFSKLLIGKIFKQDWISYRPHLPMKKAISFWTDTEPTLPPYTAAIAMKYGWIWKIPLQERFGCGYVFDSDYINADQALQEAEDHFNQKLDVRKVIEIDAGRFKNVWVKNCIAVGLSGNFIEPLESTSIWLELALLNNLKHFAHEMFDPSELSVNLFNEIIGNEVDEKMNFVYLHYMTKRSDSIFWQEFRQRNTMPDGLKKLWPYLIESNLRYQQIDNSMWPAKFPLMSYLWICSGLGIFNKDKMKDVYRNIDPSPEVYAAIVDIHLENAYDQRLFLNALKNRI